GAVGHEQEALFRIARERDVPYRAVRAGLWFDAVLLHELAFLGEDLDAIVRAVAGVDEAVVRDLGAVHRVAELARQRSGRIVRSEVEVRRRLAVGSPDTLD